MRRIWKPLMVPLVGLVALLLGCGQQPPPYTVSRAFVDQNNYVGVCAAWISEWSISRAPVIQGQKIPPTLAFHFIPAGRMGTNYIVDVTGVKMVWQVRDPQGRVIQWSYQGYSDPDPGPPLSNDLQPPDAPSPFAQQPWGMWKVVGPMSLPVGAKVSTTITVYYVIHVPGSSQPPVVGQKTIQPWFDADIKK